MIVLPPIRESSEDYEAMEKAIQTLFKKEIYLPLLREFNDGRSHVLKNSKVSALQQALMRGKLTFSRGTFGGQLNSEITKELRALGATWSFTKRAYQIPLSKLPREVQVAISSSEVRFKDKIRKIDTLLERKLPGEIAGKLKIEHLFERSLWKVNSQFKENVKSIGIKVVLSPEQVKRISKEWSGNMNLWIQDWTAKEITRLRQDIQKLVFAGNRDREAIELIKTRYGVSSDKAKFLARNEISILMAKYKQTKYEEAGISWYIWRCVTGTKQHPVRPFHLKNNGLAFQWKIGAIVDEKGNRKNPGQDYNCRCSARALVNYKGKVNGGKPVI